MHIRPRGARPTPRHRLAAAIPHRISGATPPQFIVIPPQLSMWLNDVDGDCVTAEEAFAKAAAAVMAGQPEVFVQDATVQTWATAHGVLNGADLDQVLQWMQAAGFSQGGTLYNDGPATAVDWTNAAALANAISQGPVKIGVDGDPLNALYDQLFGSGAPSNGWLATGFKQEPASAEDHCVSLCGYGSIAWLLSQFGKTVTSAVDGTQPGYALFTWNAIGVIDAPSMLAITFEAWLRNPTTVIVGPTNVTPPPPTPVGPTPQTIYDFDDVCQALETDYRAAGDYASAKRVVAVQAAGDYAITLGLVKPAARPSSECRT